MIYQSHVNDLSMTYQCHERGKPGAAVGGAGGCHTNTNPDAFINTNLRKHFSPQTRAELAQLAQEWAALIADLDAQAAVLAELAALCRAALEDSYGQP